MLTPKSESSPNTQEEQLPKTVASYIHRHSLIPKHTTLIVGVSGGPDSVCLLHLLMGLRDRLEIVLHVAHLNHMLRGAESEADAEYVSHLADHLGVAATVESRDVKGYREQHRLSLEEAAREVRYRFLAEVADKLGTERVAVGHTSDDQVETILMHLVRGAGTNGLQGMQPLTQWKSPDSSHLTVIRPLLKVSRKQTESYCQQHALAPREDSSNLSSSHLRNRIRHELMLLLRSYNPKIDEALLRTADTMNSELSFFEESVSRIWDEVVSEEAGILLLDRGKFISLHPALQRHLLREVTRRVLGSLEDIEWKHIEKMRIGFTLRKGKRVILPRKLTLYVDKQTCRLVAD